MQATDILMEEHRVIERILACLEISANKVIAGQWVRPGFFLEAAQFIKGFADGCHHHKEEGVLFKSMVTHGASDKEGPIAVMLWEHEQGRGYTRAMREAAERWESGDQSASRTAAENALAYVGLLRQHIMKEDRILFPMANQVIPLRNHDTVLEGFEHVEHEETGEGVHEKYLALAVALEKEAEGNDQSLKASSADRSR
jgi:hemerythrin-like domain-containing protein